MLDFFRDALLEIQGIDSEKAKMERFLKNQEKKENREKDKIIIPISIKKIIQVLSALYLVSCATTFGIVMKSGAWLLIVKAILQIIVVGTLFILLFFKNKRTEIICIGLMLMIFIIQYLSVYIFTVNG